MGEIADMMLDGTLDCETGEYLGLDTGFPVSKVQGSPNYYEEGNEIMPSLDDNIIGVEYIDGDWEIACLTCDYELESVTHNKEGKIFTNTIEENP